MCTTSKSQCVGGIQGKLIVSHSQHSHCNITDAETYFVITESMLHDRLIRGQPVSCYVSAIEFQGYRLVQLQTSVHTDHALCNDGAMTQLTLTRLV